MYRKIAEKQFTTNVCAEIEIVDGVPCCFVTAKRDRTRWCSSLNWAYDFEELEHDTGALMPPFAVSLHTLNRIQNWAEPYLNADVPKD